MKIECTLRSKGGTHVKLDETIYHFAQGVDGRHIADVTDRKHAQRFLSIPEAYAIADDLGEPAAPMQTKQPKGNGRSPAQTSDNGKEGEANNNGDGGGAAQ